MATIDPALTPADAAVALRSFPRRFTNALAPTEDGEDVEELALRVASDGVSALEHLVRATNTVSLFGEALGSVLRTDNPTLPPAIGDPAARVWDVPPGLTVGDGLALLDRDCTGLAELAETTPAGDWNRRGTVAGGPSVSAADLLREAVAEVAADLRATISAMGRAPD